ncbi:MAG: RNA-binding S4 domain-containing protein [Croceibacterium sp.]|jgi:ribosome-associated heat shock protein Hsp15
MRLDKLLFCLRFAKTRGAAQRWIGEGHIRHNGIRATQNDREIAPGDVLTLPLRSGVLPVEIVALPSRRGPAAEARACYRALDGRGASAIAGGETAPEEGPAQP